MKNIAFIDGQNLHLGTKCDEVPWSIDYKKLRAYLKEKYHADEAYYFPGFLKEQNQGLYTNLQKAGFIVIFKNHSEMHASEKKGNADTLMVFHMLKTLHEEYAVFEKILLVTGDGDFFETVEYLIEKNKFLKVLHPAQKNASSLYRGLGSEYYDSLSKNDTRKKIELQKEKGS
ncbi:MAG: NYN domain-containing protein [Candidatus Kaiserbacteria bacterium]|nr:NYN domain-containing protein [Candidatus Kaiserbacteria bacterium]